MSLQVVLFEVQQRTVLAELTVPYVKYVAWSADMEHVAFLAKHAIVVANKKLGNACTGALPGDMPLQQGLHASLLPLQPFKRCQLPSSMP